MERDWMGIGHHYQCKTRTISALSTQHVTNATGSHAKNKTNEDVAAVHIANCADLSYIPKGLLQIFPNLIAIYLDGCGITALNGSELNEYPTLELFALEMTAIKHIPGNLFDQTPDVFFVSFTDNTISSVGKELFNNLTQLSEVYFNNNTCINANATTMQQVAGIKEKLIHDCSFAGEIYKSVKLTVLLSVMAYFGKYCWVS